MNPFNSTILNKIKIYFKKDYSYKGIVNRLKKKYNVKISLRTLSRLLKKMELRRKNIEESSEELILLAIIMEIEGSGLNLGYRMMWKRLRNTYELKVKQKSVMKFLQIIDPEGVNARCRHRLKRRIYKVPGPNYIWHADGHDKLKRYGFPVYGCIDGFSKKVLWLKVSTTNNDPEVIGYYYLNFINKCGYLPTVMRADNGTEAVLMEDFQKVLRFMHEDEFSGENSFIRGKSTHNQRIEAYWRIFRQHVGDFYMTLFKCMEEMRLLDTTNKLHIECLRFCFGSIIQRDIEEARKEWNQHRIRKQNCRDDAGGIPNELFNMPETYGATDCRKPLNREHVTILMENYTTEPVLYSVEIEELVNLVMPRYQKPISVEQAYYLYGKIIDKIAELEM